MFSNLLNKVGWGSLPGYTIETPGPDDVTKINQNSLWEISKGKNKAGEKVTVFYANKKKLTPGQLEVARGAKALTTLRHPLILRCIDFVDNESGIYLVTEEVTPFKDDEAPHVWGIYQVLRALSFVHQQEKGHGIIDLASIFVTRSGDYRLGGFELSGALQQGSQNIVRQRQIVQLGAPDHNLPMDRSVKELDEYSAAELLKKCFNPMPQSLQALLNRRGPMMNQSFVDQLLNSQCFLDNVEVKTMTFLEELHIKEEKDKERFFELLPTVCDSLGKGIRRNQLLGHLVPAVEFSNLTASVLVSILKISPECTETDYNELILPLITKYFAIPDRSIRFRLLQAAPEYMGRMDDALVNDKLFPSLSSGFTDSAQPIREETVKALLSVVPKLKEKTREQKVWPAMLKLLRDPEPSIRCNTILCLGKLAEQYLQDQQKILMQAFTAAVQDPFPGCRGSALQVANATINLYTLDDLVGTFMPNICVRLADPDPAVSKSAFDVLPKFSSRAKELVSERHKEAEKKEKEEAAQKTAAISGEIAGADTSQPTDAKRGWGSWAMSSAATAISSKLNKNSQGPVPPPAPSGSQASPPPPPNQAKPPQHQPAQQVNDDAFDDDWLDEDFTPVQPKPEPAKPPARTGPRAQTGSQSTGMNLGNTAPKGMSLGSASNIKQQTVMDEMDWEDDDPFGGDDDFMSVDVKRKNSKGPMSLKLDTKPVAAPEPAKPSLKDLLNDDSDPFAETPMKPKSNPLGRGMSLNSAASSNTTGGVMKLGGGASTKTSGGMNFNSSTSGGGGGMKLGSSGASAENLNSTAVSKSSEGMKLGASGGSPGGVRNNSSMVSNSSGGMKLGASGGSTGGGMNNSSMVSNSSGGMKLGASGGSTGGGMKLGASGGSAAGGGMKLGASGTSTKSTSPATNSPSSANPSRSGSKSVPEAKSKAADKPVATAVDFDDDAWDFD